MPKGSWEYSDILLDMGVAKDWNVEIFDFWNMPYAQQVLMVAYSEAMNEMEAYENSLRNT